MASHTLGSDRKQISLTHLSLEVQLGGRDSIVTKTKSKPPKSSKKEQVSEESGTRTRATFVTRRLRRSVKLDLNLAP